MYQNLLLHFTQMSHHIFGDHLTGVYLHGSLAMGCFNPQKSDLDLLLVVDEEPSDEAKLAFMEQVLLLNQEAPAKGLELSIITKAAVKPFQYPTPFVLHFSPMHLGWFQQDPKGYVAHMKGDDPDLAAHCTILLQYGKVLYGAPIQEVFGEVPKAAYLDSIWQDTSGAEEDILRDPMYITLNLCRVLAYVRQSLVLSKQEGGHWGLDHLPMEHHPLIRQALHCYATDIPMTADKTAALSFAKDALAEIRCHCK
ncbi:MAG: DUF4111 domain-containing protein [Clostridia bacterium]|nr:DUF4111 domain-containing protein [Clostridia bacterium]